MGFIWRCGVNSRDMSTWKGLVKTFNDKILYFLLKKSLVSFPV